MWNDKHVNNDNETQDKMEIYVSIIDNECFSMLLISTEGIELIYDQRLQLGKPLSQ